jgi:integrase
LKYLSPSLIANYRGNLVRELINKTGRNRTSAKANRYLALLSHACTIVIKEWQWMAVNPLVQISKPREAQVRTRFLSYEERERIFSVCKSSKSTHFFAIVILALSTGIRRGEILGLNWRMLI